MPIFIFIASIAILALIMHLI